LHASLDSPSEWVQRWAGLIRRGPVLDVACGPGRHARFFHERGFEVVAVDREDQALPQGIEFLRADLEGGNPWPFEGRRFGAIGVANYLHRPLFAHLRTALDEGGVLLYETFMLGNERFGRPSNPDFLLREGELLEAFGELAVVGFEQGCVERPKKALVQRLCALRGQAEKAKIQR
jgi:SAM-dependent methyltransferase